MRGEGAATALWVDPAVHADECARFDSYVVKGPGPYIYRWGSGICVRPHRYAWARWLTVSLGLGELGLHERDMPLCVKVCGMDRPRQHASVRSARSQAAVRNAAPIRGEGPRSWLSQYQPTRRILMQIKPNFCLHLRNSGYAPAINGFRLRADPCAIRSRVVLPPGVPMPRPTTYRTRSYGWRRICPGRSPRHN